MEFGPVPGRRRPGGPTECNFPLSWVFFVFFLCLAELGGRRSGSPARIDHFDAGRDMIKGGKMVAAVREGSGTAAGFLSDHILSQTEMIGPSRAPLSPTPKPLDKGKKEGIMERTKERKAVPLVPRNKWKTTFSALPDPPPPPYPPSQSPSYPQPQLPPPAPSA